MAASYAYLKAQASFLCPRSIAWPPLFRRPVRCLPLAPSERLWIVDDMNAQEVIEQIKALQPEERAQVAKFVVECDDSWIPESFKEGMADIAAGRVVELETALNEPNRGGE